MIVPFILQPCSTRELVKMETSEDHVIKKKKHKRKVDVLTANHLLHFCSVFFCKWLSLLMWLMLDFQNWQIDEVGFQSLEMLKVRAALEEKLKQNGVFSSFAPKPNKAKKHAKSVNGY